MGTLQRDKKGGYPKGCEPENEDANKGSILGMAGMRMFSREEILKMPFASPISRQDRNGAGKRRRAFTLNTCQEGGKSGNNRCCCRRNSRWENRGCRYGLGLRVWGTRRNEGWNESKCCRRGQSRDG